MKRVLIISPYFPPSNAADMHRVRMSLPFFEQHGWHAEIVTVNPVFSDMVQDTLLSQSIDASVKVHYVNAIPKKWTSKFGLGSLALRALWSYQKEVNKLLSSKKFDLIYFSTTQFPVCILGPYWKKKFMIPYVIDMQDPWHSSYYLNKPKNERPSKYWFSYRLNKYMEPIAMSSVDGIISVSQSYINQLQERYPRLLNIPCKVLTFGYFEKDFEIAEKNTKQINLAFAKESGKINLVYIGRGGYDMVPAIRLLFNAFKDLLANHQDLVKNIKFHFIGTSYASKGMGKASFNPLAEELGISEFVEESTDRITFYESIKSLLSADGLIIPGSNDPGYTASKLYPYILAKKLLLGIFQASSSAYNIIGESNAGIVADLNNEESALEDIKIFLMKTLNREAASTIKWSYFKSFSAENMTKEQCNLFNALT